MFTENNFSALKELTNKAKKLDKFMTTEEADMISKALWKLSCTTEEQFWQLAKEVAKLLDAIEISAKMQILAEIKKLRSEI